MDDDEIKLEMKDQDVKTVYRIKKEKKEPQMNMKIQTPLLLLLIQEFYPITSKLVTKSLK